MLPLFSLSLVVHALSLSLLVRREGFVDEDDDTGSYIDVASFMEEVPGGGCRLKPIPALLTFEQGLFHTVRACQLVLHLPLCLPAFPSVIACWP